MRLSFLYFVCVIPFIESFRPTPATRLAVAGRHKALAKHVNDRLQEIKERYIELTGLLAATDLDEEAKRVYQEEKQEIQTVVESYQALDDIYRDLKTFEGVLADPDPEEERSDEKDVATVFLKEFEECRLSIETQLTSYVENGGVEGSR